MYKYNITMLEEFQEENTNGKIVDEEQEGWRWGNFKRFFRSIDFVAIRRRQEQERRRREENIRRREREARGRIANFTTQVKQLIARIQQLESIIVEKNFRIYGQNRYIAFLKEETTRLETKNKSLSDSLQYYKKLVLGTDEEDGYESKIVKQQIKYEELLKQEIGNPTPLVKNEGFGQINEGFGGLDEQINNLINRVRQLNEQINRLETTIREKEEIIKNKNSYIASIKIETTRLQKTANSLLDELQYYRTLALGNNEVDGYQNTLVKQQLKYNKLDKLEIGNTLQSSNTEGFDLQYEKYEYKLTNPIEGQNKIIEGLTSDNAAFNAVFMENQAIKNQIDNNTNTYSISKQLASHIIAKTTTLKWVNRILIFIFLIVYAYACYKIYNIPEMDMFRKIAIGIFVFLTIFIIHLIEYILVYTIPFIIALFTGIQYNPSFIFSKPGKYDYFSNL